MKIHQPQARVAIYTRISTKEGKQHFENQIERCRRYAHTQNWHIAAYFTDAESGARDKRPGLDSLMKAVTRRECDIVLVFDLSRLTRGGPSKAFSYLARLMDAGVEFRSVTEEHFRTSGPYGELFVAIAAHIAEMERTTLIHRINAGIDRAKNNGVRFGRPASVFDRDKLRAFRSQGKSIRQIAELLRISKSTVERELKG